MQTVVNALSLGSLYALFALGIAVIFGVMGLVNFAHGALITVGAYAAWWFGDQVGGGAGQRLLIGGLFGLAAGAVVAALAGARVSVGLGCSGSALPGAAVSFQLTTVPSL